MPPSSRRRQRWIRRWWSLARTRGFYVALPAAAGSYGRASRRRTTGAPSKRSRSRWPRTSKLPSSCAWRSAQLQPSRRIAPPSGPRARADRWPLPNCARRPGRGAAARPGPAARDCPGRAGRASRAGPGSGSSICSRRELELVAVRPAPDPVGELAGRLLPRPAQPVEPRRRGRSGRPPGRGRRSARDRPSSAPGSRGGGRRECSAPSRWRRSSADRQQQHRPRQLARQPAGRDADHAAVPVGAPLDHDAAAAARRAGARAPRLLHHPRLLGLRARGCAARARAASAAARSASRDSSSSSAASALSRRPAALSRGPMRKPTSAALTGGVTPACAEQRAQARASACAASAAQAERGDHAVLAGERHEVGDRAQAGDAQQRARASMRRPQRAASASAELERQADAREVGGTGRRNPAGAG